MHLPTASINHGLAAGKTPPLPSPITKHPMLTRPALGVLVALSSAIPAAVLAQSADLSICYYGPAAGETKVIRPGDIVAGTLITSRGNTVALMHEATLRFGGRTGESTFAFSSEQQRTQITGGGRREDPKEKRDLSIYWEGPSVPIEIGGYRFRLTHAEGRTEVTMTSHPEPRNCAAISSAAVEPAPRAGGGLNANDALRLLTLLDVRESTLSAAGYDPGVQVVERCDPDRAGNLECGGHYDTRSGEVCRASAAPTIIAMVSLRREAKLGGTARLTITCHGLRVHVSQTPDGAIKVTQVDVVGRTEYERTFVL